jgi:Tfp pilus assembly protein PilF
VLLYLPTSYLVPFINKISERYLFIPTLPLIAAAGIVFDRFIVRRRTAGFGALFLLLSSCAAVIVLRVPDFRDMKTLAEATLTRNPAASLSHSYMVNYYRGIGRDDLAEGHALAAIAANKKSTSSMINLGNIYADQGRFDDAEYWYLEVLKRPTNNALALSGLGLIYYNRGDLAKAKSYFQNSLNLNIRDHRVLNNYGEVLLKQGDIEEAIRQFSAADATSPAYFWSKYNLAKIAIMQKRPADARQWIEKARLCAHKAADEEKLNLLAREIQP